MAEKVDFLEALLAAEMEAYASDSTDAAAQAHPALGPQRDASMCSCTQDSTRASTNRSRNQRKRRTLLMACRRPRIPCRVRMRKQKTWRVYGTVQWAKMTKILRMPSGGRIGGGARSIGNKILRSG